ncbi:MAG: hypothetical protein IPL60_12900 [Ardenticatenia bacterium]|nr:hypothetical protein [Ardenticatenia bacterium]
MEQDEHRSKNPGDHPGPVPSAPAADRPTRPLEASLDPDQQAVEQEVAHRSPVAGQHRHADRQLVQQTRGGESGEGGAAPAERSGQRPVDAERGHLGERQVPAPAPELVERGGGQRRAEQRPRVDARQAPGAGGDVEDAEVQDEAEPRQQQQGRHGARRPVAHRRPTAMPGQPGEGDESQPFGGMSEAEDDQIPRAGLARASGAGEGAWSHARPERREAQPAPPRELRHPARPRLDRDDGLHPEQQRADDGQHPQARRLVPAQPLDAGRRPYGHEPGTRAGDASRGQTADREASDERGREDGGDNCQDARVARRIAAHGPIRPRLNSVAAL